MLQDNPGRPEPQGRLSHLLAAFTQWRRLAETDPERFCRTGLFWTFWLSLASFPIGYGAREVIPVAGLLFLLGLYRHAWQESVLARLPVRWLFLCLFCMVAIGVAFSGNPWSSFLHVGREVNKGYILPFIAMECVREERDLRRLVWASVIACFWQGLDGIWQAITGWDFIMGYKRNAGRLTGSLGDYNVGNYIALALIPAFGLWLLLRRRYSALSSVLLWLALLGPAFFLLQGAAARSGVLSVACAGGLWFLLSRQRLQWQALAIPLAVMGFFLCFQGDRLSIANLANEGRWSLWHLGWQVFLDNPWFGAGAGQYNAAFRSLGLVPLHDEITISHPHNLFLDILYAHGMVGFALGMIFLLGFLFWGWRHIRPRVLKERAGGEGVYWQLTAWFWLGYFGWLVNGIFGHDFYRMWWFALAMSYLGVMTGATWRGIEREEAVGLSGNGREPPAAV